MRVQDIPAFDSSRGQKYVDTVWADSIVPALSEYLRIPCKSPAYDNDWQKNGYLEKAVALVTEWCESHRLPDMTVDVVRLDGRTPLLFIEVPGAIDDTVLLYGHLDKQPEMVGWADDIDPWAPTLRGDRLYGRGGADDGYAVFASLTALATLHELGIPHARCLIMIECCEESGSYDLPHYFDHLSDRIGEPSLIVCLDSGCGNYDQLWCTTSLRGMVNGTLTVDILREGVHSGDASGIVASSFRIARQLLSRLEDADTGRVLADALHCEIPTDRESQAKAVADALGNGVWDHFPWADGAGPISTDNAELILGRTWRPTVAVTGAGGLPALENAGSVLRPQTALRLNIRLPPNVPGKSALAAVRELLEASPPYGAQVSFSHGESSDGWNAPILAPWLERALANASNACFGREAMFMGEGGTIPFMAMLGQRFPHAQYLITGVLGPESNAHGPNEFLHLPTARKLTCATAHVLREHAAAVLS